MTSPGHGGYAWTEWLAAEMERNPMDHNTVPQATAAPTCPDGGTCHHQCGEKCHRVATCEPLSGVFPGDTWPEGIHAQHTRAAEPKTTCKCPAGDCGHKAAAPEVVHRCPIGASGETPCCGTRSLLLPRTDRITLENSSVTCTPTPMIIYHADPRMLPPKPANPAEPYDIWDPKNHPHYDPGESYECGLRDLHADDEHHALGWADFINKATDREQMEFVPYTEIRYPEGSNIKPLRVCEGCATYLHTLAPYMTKGADSSKITDRYAFDYPTADALDALHRLALAEDPVTGQRLDLDAMDAHERSALGSQVLREIHTPLTTSSRVLNGVLHFNQPEMDTHLLAVHQQATRLLDNTGDPAALLDTLVRLQGFLNRPDWNTAS